HQARDYERYDYPGRYKRDAAGSPFTRDRLRDDAYWSQPHHSAPRTPNP
ncbi:hypothetical protein HPR94_29880, partial [Pseudomonas aeruginosa]|nr:hypothetical protein [Pseudomonas aeruginosa]